MSRRQVVFLIAYAVGCLILIGSMSESPIQSAVVGLLVLVTGFVGGRAKGFAEAVAIVKTNMDGAFRREERVQ